MRKLIGLFFLASLGLVLAAGLTQGGLALFTDQATVTGNTFTTAASFPTPMPTPGPTDTGFKSPSATGQDYNQWSNPTNAFASDNSRAREDRNGQQQDWYNFTFGVPGGATIVGIEVSVEAVDWDCSNDGVDIELSWDGGTSYTSSGKGASWPCETEVTNTFGGSADTWGRTWSDFEFSNANFRLRLTKTGTDWVFIFVDHVQAKVYYQGP